MSMVSKVQELVATFDWSGTALGPRNQWPKSLASMVEMILRQPAAMIVLWGPDLIQIYNDGYAEIAGTPAPTNCSNRRTARH